MLKRTLLYEVSLRGRFENVKATARKHKWSGKTLYTLSRYGRVVTLFVPTPAQRDKIRRRLGTIRIYSSQTESGTGLGR